MAREGSRRSLSLPGKRLESSKIYFLLVVGQTVGLLGHLVVGQTIVLLSHVTEQSNGLADN